MIVAPPGRPACPLRRGLLPEAEEQHPVSKDVQDPGWSSLATRAEPSALAAAASSLSEPGATGAAVAVRAGLSLSSEPGIGYSPSHLIAGCAGYRLEALFIITLEKQDDPHPDTAAVYRGPRRLLLSLFLQPNRPRALLYLDLQRSKDVYRFALGASWPPPVASV